MMGFVIITTLALVTFTLRLSIAAPGFPSSPTGSHDDGLHRGAVASESSVCTNIGIDMLRNGGSAADAVSLGSSLSFPLINIACGNS